MNYYKATIKHDEVIVNRVTQGGPVEDEKARIQIPAVATVVTK